MKKGQRVLLAIGACIGIFVAWQVYFQPLVPPDQVDGIGTGDQMATPQKDCTVDTEGCYQLAHEFLNDDAYDRNKAMGPALRLLSDACRHDHAPSCDLFAKTYNIEGMAEIHRSDPVLAKTACDLGIAAGCDRASMEGAADVGMFILVGLFILWFILKTLGVLDGTIATDMPYANGKRRAVGVLVEWTAIMIVFYVGLPMILPENGISRVWANSILGSILVLYPIVTQRLWGQNLGKLVAGIAVVQVDGSKLTWRHAVIRSLPDVALSFVSTALYLSTAMALEDELVLLDYMAQLRRIYRHLPTAHHWLTAAGYIWLGSEALVVLYNRRRRAIHDFLAGTVVLMKKDMSSSSLSVASADSDDEAAQQT